MEQRLSLVVVEDLESNSVLLTQARPVSFPLTKETEEIIDKMLFELVEQKAAGFAAPQFGIGERVIVYHVTSYAKEVRENAGDLLEPTVLINPSFTPIVENGFQEDWEGCFSVDTEMGKIRRFESIIYEGQDREGKPVKGQADGYLARILQHEIDHINGILMMQRQCEDLPFGPKDQMMQMRLKEIEERKARLQTL